MIRSTFKTFKNILIKNKSRSSFKKMIMYSQFENGLLFLIDGTVAAIFEYEGYTLETTEVAAYIQIQQKVKNALSIMPNNTTVQKVDIYTEKEYNKINNENPLATTTSRYFKGRTGVRHKSYLYLIFSNKTIDNPLLTALNKLQVDVNVISNNPKALDDVIDHVNTFKSSFPGSLRLVTDLRELYGLFHSSINFDGFNQKKRDNFGLIGDIIKEKNYIQVGNKLLSYVTMLSQPTSLNRDIPNENNVPVSYTGKLHQLSFPHTVQTIIKKIDTQDKLGILDNEKFYQNSFFNDPNDVRGEEHQVRHNKVRDCTLKIRQENLELYQVGIGVCVYALNSETLKRRINKTINAFTDSGFEALPETYDNLMLFNASFPAKGHNFYRTICTTGDCASVYLNTDTVFNGDAEDNYEGITFIDRNKYPIKYKLISPETDGPHLLAIGPTGTGKTHLFKHILKTRYYQGFRQMIVDQKGDFREIVKELGGLHIDYDPSNPIKLNPFLIGDHNNEKKLEFLTNFLMSFYIKDTLNDDSIDYAVILKRLDLYLKKEAGVPTLHNLYDFGYVAHQFEETPGFNENRFKLSLELYGKGIYKNLFNHTNVDFDNFTDNKILSFDFEQIKEARYYQQVFSMIAEISNDMVAKYPLAPKSITLDECWAQLQNNPKFINDWLRTGRSKKMAVNILTQGIDEIITSKIGQTIIANTDTKILLDHSEKSDQIKTIAEALSLTNHEVSLFKSLSRGEEYREIFVKQNKALVLGVEVPQVSTKELFQAENVLI